MAPFSQGTCDEINGFVARNTKKQIPKMLDPLEPEKLAVMVNAVTFDGQWAVPYTKSDTKQKLT